MQGYFEENPTDLAALRRDKALHTVRVQPQLAHVPDYLLPPALRTDDPSSSSTTAIVGEETDISAPTPATAKRKQPPSYGSAKRHKYQVSSRIL